VCVSGSAGHRAEVARRVHRISREDALIGRLKAAKVFVLSSTREGFSITTLEAMACGLPVVTVDAPRNYAGGLMQDSVTGRMGAMDEKSIRNAIIDYVFNENSSKKMSDMCKKAANKYDRDSIAMTLERSYSR